MTVAVAGVKIPAKATLKRYGLVLIEWQLMFVRQNGRCGICKEVPSTGRLVVDHEHVKGWKKMPPAKRKLYVRGLLCWLCNKNLVGRGVTTPLLKNAVTYMEVYDGTKCSDVSIPA